MNFDWTKPMVIDWSGRNGPVIKEEDIKYSVIKRIIRNQYTAPLCDLQFTRVKPPWSPHDPFATNVGNNRSRRYSNFIPGLHPVPPYPQLSTLTKAQHQQAVRVLSAKYHSVQPRDYVLPNDKSYQVFQEIQELYEIEQKEYKKWAKQLWINGDCIRALRPKPIIEKVYEAEFKMRSTEIQSLPKNYTLAAQIPLETKNHTFEFEHKRDLINVDIQDLPIVDYPDVMDNDISVLKPYPIPEPCTEHPCKFLLPDENSVSGLPLSEIQHLIGQYAIENGVSFAASENALRCLVETDRSWKIPVAVLEAVGPDGDLRNVVVLGSEFGVQKECATQRTYKAYKHLLRHTFAPSTGHYQIKTPFKQTTMLPTSVPHIEKPVASNYNRLDSLDTDLPGSSDDEDKLLIDYVQKCQPNLPGLDSKLISEQDGSAIDDFTKGPYEPSINEFGVEPESEHGDKSDGESNSERDSDERRSEPDRYMINDIELTSEQDGLAVEDFTKDPYEPGNNEFGVEPEAEHGNKSDGELNSERYRIMINENKTNPEVSYNNNKPSYYQDSYEPDFFNVEERPNYGHNEPSSDSDQVMIDDANALKPSYTTYPKESSYSVDTSNRPETIKPWMNKTTYSNYSRESSYTNTEESRYSIDNTAKPKTFTPWMSDSTYSKNASDLNYCIIKESSYSFHTVETSREPSYNNESCQPSFSTNKESTCSNESSKPIYSINKESNYSNKSSEPSYSIDEVSNYSIDCIAPSCSKPHTSNPINKPRYSNDTSDSSDVETDTDNARMKLFNTNKHVQMLEPKEVQPKKPDTLPTEPILSSNQLNTTELRECKVSSRKFTDVTETSPVKLCTVSEEPLKIDSCIRKQIISVTNTVKVYKSKAGQQKVNAIKPCIKKQSPYPSPLKNTRKQSFSDSVVSECSTPETKNSSQSKDIVKNLSTNLPTEDISNERAKRLCKDIYREHHYGCLENFGKNEFPLIRNTSVQKSNNSLSASSDTDNSSPEKLNLNIASKPNDSKKKPGVRRLSFNETVPANTKKSIINYSATSDPKNVEANKPMSNSVKPKAGKVSLRELFGDVSDSDDSICTNTNIYIDITAKKNNIRAPSESTITSTSAETKPISIDILNSDKGTEPCTNLNCRKLSDPIIVVIDKSPTKPSLRKASFSEPSPGKGNRKLSFSDSLSSDPEFRGYHSEPDSEESLAGFNNDGIAVSTNEIKKKHECVPDGLRTRKKPIAKYATRKSQTKQTINKIAFTKTLLIKKENNQNKKIEKVTPRRSRRISALLNSDSNDDSYYPESSRRTSTRIKNNNQMKVERPGVIRRRRLSSRVFPEDSDETKTNINAKVLTENTNVLRRSRRLSVLNAKENVQPKSNIRNTNVHKSHETNTKTNKITVNSNSLSKVTKKCRRKSLPTNIFSKKEKNNQVHTSSNSLNNLYDIAKMNESLRSNSRSSTSTPLHCIDKNKTFEISERTKRYFYRSLSLYLETDRSEDEMSESTKRFLRRSISSAYSETEQAYSDLKKRTKKYTRRSNTTQAQPCAKKTSISKPAAVLNVESIDDEELSERTKRHKSRLTNLVYSSCDESEQPKTIGRKKTRRPPEKNHSYLSHTATINQATTRLKSEVRDTTENHSDSINPIELGLSDANENGTEICKIKIDIVEETTDEIEMVATKIMQKAERDQTDTTEDNFNTEAQSFDRYNRADKYEENNIFHFRVANIEGPDLESSNTDDTLFINHTLDSSQAIDVTKQMEIDKNKVLNFRETNRVEIDNTDVDASEREDNLFTFEITNTLSNTSNGTNAANQTESNEANQIEYQNKDQELTQIAPETDITNLTKNNDIIQFRKLSISEVSDNSDYYFENNDTQELNIYHFTARNETDTENESQKDSPTVENPRLANNAQPCSSKINTETVIHQTAECTGDKMQKSEIDQPGSSRTQNRFYNYQSNITETNQMETNVPLNTAEIETNYFDRGRKISLFPSGSSEDLNHEPFDGSELSRQAIDDIIGVNNCVCKGSLFETPPPRSFKKWQVRNTTSNVAFSLIVHSSHKAGNGSKEVLLEPIVEYQPELGGAKQSAEKIRSIALALMIREKAELINARIDHENGNVIVIENLSEAEFISRHGDQRSNVADTLHTAINQLRFLLPGQYVLAHDACHGANAMLYTSRGAGAAKDALALSLQQNDINMPDAEDALHAKVPPELDGVLLPYHKFRSTAPLAFTPYPRQVRGERRAALARAKHPPHAIQWPKKKKCKRSRH